MSLPNLSWEVSTIGFTDFAQDLARMSGQSLDHVLTNQTGKVLEVAAAPNSTPRRSAADIERSVK